MPDTQAYSADWTVTIAPEGDVSEDVTELKIIREDGINTATVELDTSERPHALMEREDIHISITDGNDTVEFDGYTDAVEDDPEDPIVQVDARSLPGALDDADAVGVISEDTIWDCIDALLDSSPGQVREITFDPQPLKDEFGTFANSTNYAGITGSDTSGKGLDAVILNDKQTSEYGQEVELRFDYYENPTSEFYTLNIEGQDANGTTVTATIDLPPGSDAQDAFGSDSVKLALSGGNQLWTDVTSVTMDSPSGVDGLYFAAEIWNHVKTDWRFRPGENTSIRAALEDMVAYLSGLDAARTWGFTVDIDSQTLNVRPDEERPEPDTHVFREGDNVLKPVANRDIDGLRNFIKVEGPIYAGWFWAYNGTKRYLLQNPFDTGSFPGGGIPFGNTPAGGQFDIDQINLRAEKLQSDTFTDRLQILYIGRKALDEFVQVPVNGKAPMAGVKNVEVGDIAEVYYPSRGIPQKVVDNQYAVEKVEYDLTPNECITTVEFAASKPDMADMINAGGAMIRNDLSSDVARYAQNVTTSQQAARQGQADVGGFPAVGTLQSQNDDGTWTVETEDGETYDDVRVI